MKKIKLDNLENPRKEIIDTVVDYLFRQKVIAYPTDTVYGLGCLATSEKAVEKIYQIKGRVKQKPLLVLVDSLEMAREYFQISPGQEKILEEKWPAAVSFILKDKQKLAPELNQEGGGLAVRLPKNEFLTKIIGKLKKPITSTSLNKSGEERLSRVSDIEKYFSEEEIDLVVDAGTLEGKPSEIIDLRENSLGEKIR